MISPPIIEHRKGYWVAVLHEDYLHICDRNYCAAMLLKQFEHWHSIKLEHLGQVQALNASLETNGGAPNQSLDLWVFKTNVEAHQELMGMFGERAVEDGLKLLIAKGFVLVRNNPAKKWDRTLQYLFLVHTVQAAVRGLPPVPPHDYKNSKPQKCDKHSADLRHAERTLTIGQICGLYSANLPDGERISATSKPHGCGSNTSENTERTSIKNTTTTTPTQAAPERQASVVVSLQMQRESSSTRDGERSTRLSKPTQSGMTPLLDMLPPVSPPGVHPKGKTAPSQAPGGLLAPTNEGSKALAVLMEQGVKPLSTAKRLVAQHGERLCLDWIDALPYCSYNDPARYLVAALDKGYKLPDALFAARKDKQRRAEQVQEEKRRAELIRQAAEAERQEAEEADKHWKALTPAQQAQFESDARDEIAKRPLGSRLLEGPLGQEQLRKRRLELAMEYNQKNAQKAA